MRGAMAIVGIVLLATGAVLLAGTGLVIVEDGGGGNEMALDGYVKDATTRTGISGAVLRFCKLANPNECRSATTNAQGYYFLHLWPNTAVHIRVTASGYVTYETDWTTLGASPTTNRKDFNLNPAQVGGSPPPTQPPFIDCTATPNDPGCTDDAPPPPPPAPNIGRLALMGLGIIFLVFGGALIASDALELLGG